MEVHIAIPSYRRSDRVRALAVFPGATLYVPQSQVDDYREHNGRAEVVAVPDGVEGNLALKRNWIIEHSPSRYLLMVDDDVEQLARWERDEWAALNPVQAADFTMQGFRMCEDAGARFWGVNVLLDKRAYSVFRPFKLLAPVLGPFGGHVLDHGLRYDPAMGAKEDYDFWLQQIERYRRTLRFDKYHYAKAEETRGGWYSSRTAARELEWADRIVRKWGGAIKYNGKKNLLDGRVAIPIPGC